MTSSLNILSEAENYVHKILKNHLPSEVTYHNIEHTQNVVAATEELAGGNGLNDEETEIVLLAAWFHDTGYIDGYENHEENSVKYASQFFEKKSYPKEKIEKANGCIRATKMPQQPSNLLEHVVCDADLSSIGMERQFDKGQQIRKEWALTREMDLSEEEWFAQELDFFEGHEFFTPYAKQIYNERKAVNIQKIKKQLAQLKNQENMDRKTGKDKNKKDKKPPKEKHNERLSRGVETMFRTSLRNHLALSSIADGKANTMLSINAIIISITVSVLLPAFEENPKLILPTVMLLIVCLITIIFAVLSTRPSITSGTFLKSDIENKSANLLFFGNFHNMALEDFQWGIREMMIDKDFLYGSLTRDLYNLGKVLAQKYRYLRVCYNVFMYGLIGSLLAFVVVFSVSL